jgi:hypothetical protein
MPNAEPHFKWFDNRATGVAFLSSPVFTEGRWARTGMWCCCAWIADTPIAIPIGTELVKNLKKGDAVLAGSVTPSSGRVAVSWSDQAVKYAGELQDPADTDPGDAKAILINFGAGHNLIVSSYQLMFTSSGKLKQALRLSLGDKLLSKAGEEVTINEIKLGEFVGQRYHIGIDQAFNDNVDGHLLALNDIIIGDYVLQKNRKSLPASMVGDAVA